MAPRSVWKGQLRLSLVSIPVELYSAVDRGSALSFRQIHAPSGKPVRHEKVVPGIGPVDADDIRKGYEVGEDDYVLRGSGMGREATLWLLERGVRVTGTDGWSWDAPFTLTRKRWEETRDPSIIWEGHRASIDIGYCHMEKLANLDRLPDHGFEVICFPYKIKAASAGFIRAVAVLEG